MNNKFNSMLRDLKSFSKRLKVILMTKRHEDREEARILALKIKSLIYRLKPQFGSKKIKNALGVLAVLFGFGNQVCAQTFAPPLSTPFGLTQTNIVAIPSFVDIDNDGDLDLFVAGYSEVTSYGNSLKYFQNIGTNSNPQFADALENPFGIENYMYVDCFTFGDIDADGDQDLFIGTVHGDVEFFLNTGSASNPQFAAPVTNPFGIQPSYYIAAPTLADMDNDGDLDLLIGSYEYIYAPYYYFKGLNYYKNIGSASAPEFELQTDANDPFNDITVGEFAYPHLLDMDGDGDYDLIYGGYYGELQYHENTGTATNPTFSSAGQTNPFGLQAGYYISAITSGDLDNDGDVDILIGEYYGEMKYYRNTSINLSVESIVEVDFSLYPNPASDWLNIQADPNLIGLVEVLDLNGNLIKSYTSWEKGINIEDLATGIYLIKLTAENSEVRINRFVKK